MKRSKKLPRGFIIGGAVFSMNVAVLLAILTWPDSVKTRVDVEPRFTSGWSLPRKPVKVATYNFAFGKRLDDCIELLKREEPDIVCVQEILEKDLGRIEAGLGMKGTWFGSSNQSDDGFYGKALLARGKLTEPQTLPNPKGGSFGAWAAVEIHGGRFLAGSLHFRDLKAPRAGFPARENEIRALRDAVRKVGAPAIFGGDLNTPSNSGNYELLTEWFTDLSADSGMTHPSRLPVVRIDYVFGTEEWEAISA